MEKLILVINIGSASKKYSLYSGNNLLLTAHFERDKDSFALSYSNETTLSTTQDIFENALETFIKKAREKALISEAKPIQNIGFRIVAPGVFFAVDRTVDEEFLKRLNAIAQNDLVHIGPMIQEMEKTRSLFPNIQIVAVSDSAFHSTLLKVARDYAIPKALVENEDLYRFGYHGLSVSSIASNPKLKEVIGGKVIVCHLGSGASITALLDGQSVDTSMGYSPLEGLIMSSRVGNIDVGAVLNLTRKHSPNELEEIFYNQSGLLAISGLSDDMRILLDAEKEGHGGAKDAVEAFVYHIIKYIGAYTAVLGGVEAIVFSGTIGERSFIIREKICKELSWLDLNINNEKNISAVDGDDISNGGKVKVFVIHTDEAGEMLKKMSNVVN